MKCGKMLNLEEPGVPGSPKTRKFWKHCRGSFDNVKVLEIVNIYFNIQATKCGKFLNSKEPGVPGSPKTRKFWKHCRGSFENIKVLESVIVYPISVWNSLELG